jgi:hypothetical protein
MIYLTKNQTETIVNNFFILEEYPGSKNIAETLLAKGFCIVAGDECIWKGGVGNFITTTVAEEYFGCLRYEFNLSEFLKSNYFKDFLKIEIESLEKQSNEILSKVNDLQGFYQFK